MQAGQLLDLIMRQFPGGRERERETPSEGEAGGQEKQVRQDMPSEGWEAPAGMRLLTCLPARGLPFLLLHPKA